VDPNNVVMASAVSGWEIELKRALGKLDAPDDLEEQLARSRIVELPLRLRHLGGLSRLPSIHRDPFDRILAAQAAVDGLTLVTRDRRLSEYPIKTLRA
jgi:PIN domain nuclease of toxin-antitoxin system